jgi:hypothetical protein
VLAGILHFTHRLYGPEVAVLNDGLRRFDLRIARLRIIPIDRRLHRPGRGCDASGGLLLHDLLSGRRRFNGLIGGLRRLLRNLQRRLILLRTDGRGHQAGQRGGADRREDGDRDGRRGEQRVKARFRFHGIVLL